MIPVTEQWVDHAACRSIGGEIFYPEPGQDWRAPKQICLSSCPVRLQCLDAAMRQELGLTRNWRFGIAGGLSPEGRLKYEPEWLAEQTSAA